MYGDSPAKTLAWRQRPVYPASAAVSGFNSRGAARPAPRWLAIKMFPGLRSSDRNQAPTSVSYSGGCRPRVRRGLAGSGRALVRSPPASPSSVRRRLSQRPQRAQAVLAVCESCGGNLRRAKLRSKTAPTLDHGARGTSLDLPMTLDVQNCTRRHSGRHTDEQRKRPVPAGRPPRPRGQGLHPRGQNNFRTHNLVDGVANSPRSM